jgi:hypothetical protein
VPLRTSLRCLKTLFGVSLVSCALAGVCPAAELSAELPASERNSMAERYLHEKLSLWQARLKLEDWRISVVTSSPADLRGGTLGNVHWDPEKKTAVIRVLEASRYDTTFAATLRDLEFTVVHELVHLEFCTSTRTDESSRASEEIAVNHIAEALLQLDRKESDQQQISRAESAPPN